MESVQDHTFGQERERPGERRTRLVILITAVMMAVEIAAGWRYGSMALLADGLHMASHAAALTISAIAYVFARRYARDRRFSFGTGKVNALGGFAGAVLLAMFALLMAFESLHRLLVPVAIGFNQAILVACVGLVVNGVSVWILRDHPHDEHDAAHHAHGHHEAEHTHDHNLRSAYLHVLADALTSILAIGALLAGKCLGWRFMDPLMGIVGAVLVARWSLGLLRETGGALLDVQAPEAITASLQRAMTSDGKTRVVDLHVWSIGPGYHAAIITVAGAPGLGAADYRARIPPELRIAHATVEIIVPARA